MAVSLLTTRSKSSYEYEWGKIKRLLKYLKGTKHTKLMLKVDSLLVVNWRIDASDNTHDDCKGK